MKRTLRLFSIVALLTACLSCDFFVKPCYVCETQTWQGTNRINTKAFEVCGQSEMEKYHGKKENVGSYRLETYCSSKK